MAEDVNAAANANAAVKNGEEVSYCHQCGAVFNRMSANFCSQCGCKKLIFKKLFSSLMVLRLYVYISHGGCGGTSSCIIILLLTYLTVCY